LWILLIGAAKNIAFKSVRKSIKGVDRQPAAATTPGGAPQENASRQFTRFVLSVDDRDAFKPQPLRITSFRTRAT
jgi:hypothetical protein